MVGKKSSTTSERVEEVGVGAWTTAKSEIMELMLHIDDELILSAARDEVRQEVLRAYKSLPKEEQAKIAGVLVKQMISSLERKPSIKRELRFQN